MNEKRKNALIIIMAVGWAVMLASGWKDSATPGGNDGVNLGNDQRAFNGYICAQDGKSSTPGTFVWTETSTGWRLSFWQWHTDSSHGGWITQELPK